MQLHQLPLCKNKECFQFPEVREGFITYYSACFAEVEDLKKLYNISIFDSDKIIFGHTYKPIPLENSVPLISLSRASLAFRNMGGWITNPDNGATGLIRDYILKYETLVGLHI